MKFSNIWSSDNVELINFEFLGLFATRKNFWKVVYAISFKPTH